MAVFHSDAHDSYRTGHLTPEPRQLIQNPAAVVIYSAVMRILFSSNLIKSAMFLQTNVLKVIVTFYNPRKLTKQCKATVL